MHSVCMVLNNPFNSILHIASICADCDHSYPLCSKNSIFYLRGFLPQQSAGNSPGSGRRAGPGHFQSIGENPEPSSLALAGPAPTASLLC